MKIQLLLAAVCLLTTACADKAPDKKARPMTAAQQHPFLNRVVGSGQVSAYSRNDNGSGKRRGKRTSVALGGSRASDSRRREVANRTRSAASTESAFAPARRASSLEGAKTAAVDHSLDAILGNPTAAADNQPKPLVLSTPSD